MRGYGGGKERGKCHMLYYFYWKKRKLVASASKTGRRSRIVCSQMTWIHTAQLWRLHWKLLRPNKEILVKTVGIQIITFLYKNEHVQNENKGNSFMKASIFNRKVKELYREIYTTCMKWTESYSVFMNWVCQNPYTSLYDLWIQYEPY